MTINSLSYKLYTDHLEEVDFLLTQRVVLFSDPEVDWPEIDEFEQRLAAHVHGLTLGGEVADQICADILNSDDPDQIRAAVYALAHSKSATALKPVWAALTDTTPDLAEAYFDGLKHTSNATILTGLTTLVTHENPLVRTTAIRTLGYRREVESGVISQALNETEPLVVDAAVFACQRGRMNACVPDLLNLLNHSDLTIAAEAALALALYQMPEGAQWLRTRCQTQPTEPTKAELYLALCGHSADSQILMHEDDLSLEQIRALGILGNPDAVPFLLDKLTNDDDLLSLEAAMSLQLITGANLVEEYTESDEFVDEEGDIIESAESNYERVSTSSPEWSDFWSQEQSRFVAGARYRSGHPFSSSALIAELKKPDSKLMRRQLAYLELLINQAITEPFEADWLVSRQIQTLDRW